MELDKIDKLILQVLEDDPRISNRKISEVVGLTPQAVGIRIKKMKDAQIIGGIKILKPLPETSKDVKEVERFQTKILGFDYHIGGGFPNPCTILLTGETGAGTTTFCLKLLWTAINTGLKCAYFAIERPVEQVIQQLKSFGWNLPQTENIKFIDIYSIINQEIHNFESVAHLDILKIYREMIKYHKELLPEIDILFLDSFTELIKLVRDWPIEKELINQLGISIRKHRTELMTFYVIKPHVISEDILRNLKSHADCIINFRKEFYNQGFRRYLLIEKMLFTNHTTREIEFHITNQGIVLNEYMLQYKALQNPPSSIGSALFNIQELDYLTQGLPYGTTWLLEIDSYFPLNDLLKLYVNFFINGLDQEGVCLFAFPKVSLRNLINLFKQSINNFKSLRKKNATLNDFIIQNQLLLYDLFQKADLLVNEEESTFFLPISWSSDPEKNLKFLGMKLTENKSNYKYLGINISDLLEIPFGEEQLLNLCEYLRRFIQKQGDILLATLNPSLHSQSFINKMEYYADGIIKLWVDAQNPISQDKYIQIIKNPQGSTSPSHLLQVTDIPPYFQII